MNLDQFLQHPALGKTTKTSWGYKGHCPSHDDKTESLSLKEGDDGRILVKCHAGCFAEDVVEAMGLTMRDLMPSTNGAHPPGELTVYPYRDESGELLFEAVRTPDKRFWQRLPGQKGGSLGNVRRVLYGLPDLLKAEPGDTVFIAEGEKDVENLKKAGLIATTSPAGAGKWRDEHGDWLREKIPGCRFVVLPDNDDAGESHAATVHQSLVDRGLRAEIVRLPDLPEKGDVSDWIKAGNDPQTLLTIESVAARPAVHIKTDNLPAAAGWDAPSPLYAAVLPAFPLGALPSWLADQVEAVAEATQTPPDLAGMLALSVLATAMQKRMEALVRPGWREPLSIWTVTALPPGNRKSPAYGPMVQPVIDYETQTVRDTAKEIAVKETDYKIAEGAHKRAVDQAIKAKTEMDRMTASREAGRLAEILQEMTVPVSPRLIADDATPERMGMLLSAHGGRMAVLSPEGDVFDVMAGKYSSGTANIGIYLRGHSGDDLIVDRVGRPAIIVRRAAITFGLCVQPDTMLGLNATPAFRGRGLMGRTLFAIPMSTLGTRTVRPQPVPESVAQVYDLRIKQILSLPAKTDDDGNIIPYLVPFSGEADNEVARFEEWIEPQLKPGGELGHMADWAGKLAGQMVRIAALTHGTMGDISEPPWTRQVSGATVSAAQEIARYLIPHARAAFQAMGTDPAINGARELLEWIKRHGLHRFTKRDAFNGLRSQFARAADIEPPISVLVEHGYLRPVVEEKKHGPGQPPSPRYEVHPSLRSA